MHQSATQSTGPRTAEGKARSSMNALKHGLASGQLIIPGEDPAVYDALLNGFLTDYRPINQIETALVHEITKAYWLKDRALRFQTIAFEITMPHLEKMAAPMDLSVLIRYQSANERNFYRAIKTLQGIQKERKSAPVGLELSYSLDQPEIEKAAEPEFVSQTAPQTPGEELASLLKAREEIQECIAGFVEIHPDCPGVIKSVAENGVVSYRAA
jgi:hypothetical protein